MEPSSFPDVKPLFLRALEFPEYARPEFYLQAQKASGWSKGVFLTALFNAYQYYKMHLDFSAGVARRKCEEENRTFDLNEFALDLDKETKGAQQGELTKALLEDLYHAVDFVHKLERPTRIYTAYEILSFCERLFMFIKKEFQDQCTPNGSAFFVAERKRKDGHQIEEQPEYLLYHYTIISEAPILDFYRFKNEVRHLLLTAQNPKELVTILRPFFEYAVQIVELWNKKLSPIAEPFGKHSALKGKGIFDQRLLTFDPNTLQIWHRNVLDEKDYYREPSQHYQNRDFAQFAARVANLIASEVLKLKKTTPLPEEAVPTDFDQLFADPSYIAPAYELLMEADLIDENFRYKKGLKSAFCLWVEELKAGRNPVISYQHDKVYTELLNKKIKGLRLSFTNFGKPKPKAIANYQPLFRAGVSKLSQLSEKGKERK